MTWSPSQYLAFEDDRTRPVRDLAAAIPTAARTAVDVGCGPGNSTEVLAARFQGAAVSGFDSSPEMVEAARRRLPGLSFEVADVTGWTPGGACDVLLSNAVLQWLPDHAALFPRLAGFLAPGGTLAVQMPDNMDEPSQAAMREVAAQGPWAGALAGAGGFRPSISDAAGYYRMMRPHCARVDIWTTTYQHVLPGGLDAVVEWFKGSGLRPFLGPLDAGQREGFLAEYRARLAPHFPPMPDGSVLLPFPRLFIVATR